MLDTGHQAGKPSKYDGKGGQSFKIRAIKYTAWMHNIGIWAVLSPGFDGALPAKEATIPNLTQPSDEAHSVANALNEKAVNGCVFGVRNGRNVE